MSTVYQTLIDGPNPYQISDHQPSVRTLLERVRVFVMMDEILYLYNLNSLGDALFVPAVSP